MITTPPRTGRPLQSAQFASTLPPRMKLAVEGTNWPQAPWIVSTAQNTNYCVWSRILFFSEVWIQFFAEQLWQFHVIPAESRPLRGSHALFVLITSNSSWFMTACSKSVLTLQLSLFPKYYRKWRVRPEWGSNKKGKNDDLGCYLLVCSRESSCITFNLFLVVLKFFSNSSSCGRMLQSEPNAWSTGNPGAKHKPASF